MTGVEIGRNRRQAPAVTALLTGGHTATYAYNASGQRTRKMVVNASVVEERIYLGSYEVWRKRSSGTLAVERQAVYGGVSIDPVGRCDRFGAGESFEERAIVSEANETTTVALAADDAKTSFWRTRGAPSRFLRWPEVITP